jgi:predicted heme/steroid binding protein
MYSCDSLYTIAGMAGAKKKTGPSPKKGPQIAVAEKKTGWSLQNAVTYLAVILLISSYGVFLVNPVAFGGYAKQYAVIKPLEQFFQAVETYSPFHEYANEEEINAQIRKDKAAPTPSKNPGSKVFSKAELKEYDGSDTSKGPYLSLMGEVFDVSKGKDHYGPGGGYDFFSGRDGSRAFVTGEFNEEGLIEDIEGLGNQDYLGLQEWLEFYHKDYNYLGKLDGRFYDARGEETEYMAKARVWISAAMADKDKQNEEKKLFPPCNSEWSAEKGHRVWCTNKSGGMDRPWIGRPRRLFYPGRKERCACVRDTGPPSTDMSAGGTVGDLANPHLKEYEGCDPKGNSCMIREPEEKEKKEEL